MSKVDAHNCSHPIFCPSTDIASCADALRLSSSIIPLLKTASSVWLCRLPSASLNLSFPPLPPSFSPQTGLLGFSRMDTCGILCTGLTTCSGSAVPSAANGGASAPPSASLRPLPLHRHGNREEPTDSLSAAAVWRCIICGDKPLGGALWLAFISEAPHEC